MILHIHILQAKVRYCAYTSYTSVLKLCIHVLQNAHHSSMTMVLRSCVQVASALKSVKAIVMYRGDVPGGTNCGIPVYTWDQFMEVSVTDILFLFSFHSEKLQRELQCRLHI